jgi:cell division protease FtsH
MLGGRAAERLVYDDVTTGAESDLEQATALARQMVGRWGMSEAIGAMSVLADPRREQPLSLDGNAASSSTRELIDTEARRILESCFQQAIELLTRERVRLEALVDELLEKETLEAGEIYRASGLPDPHEHGQYAPGGGLTLG